MELAPVMRSALLGLLLLATIAHSRKDQYSLELSMYDDINYHRVMLYSKTYCPYSKKMKVMLHRYGIRGMKTVELNEEEQMSEMQDYLETLSGRRTVPQLFVDGQFVGGYDDTKVLEEEGELEKRLMTAGAIPWRRARL